MIFRRWTIRRPTPNFKKPVTHQVFYNPEANQRGNEVMRWQQGGYDMEYRMQDNAREGIDFQLIFPTSIDIPSQNPGPLGAAVARAYNNWSRQAGRGSSRSLVSGGNDPCRLSGRNGRRAEALH